MSFCTLVQVTLNVGLMRARKGFTSVAGEEELVLDTEERVFEPLGRGDHRMLQGWIPEPWEGIYSNRGELYRDRKALDSIPG